MLLSPRVLGTTLSRCHVFLVLELFIHKQSQNVDVVFRLNDPSLDSAGFRGALVWCLGEEYDRSLLCLKRRPAPVLPVESVVDDDDGLDAFRLS